MVRVILNDDHLGGAIGAAIAACRHRLFIATADVKDLHLPSEQLAAGAVRKPNRQAVSIVDVFHSLAQQNVQVQLLHSGVPSGPFLAELKKGLPQTLTMRRCPRLHAKAVIADGRLMYLGSANLTGAGLGAKSVRRRNFEAGIWTDEIPLIDPVADMLEGVFSGDQCPSCGRRDYCPVPLEEPRL